MATETENMQASRRRKQMEPLRKYLASHGTRLSWVAEQMGMPYWRFYQILSGRFRIPRSFLKHVAAVLDIPPELIGGSTTKTRKSA